jgi:Co/Zn/Cd efflux system component
VLTTPRYFRSPWLDPVMGFAGSVLIIFWSFALIKKSSSVLLDHNGPGEIRESLEASLEGLNVQVTDCTAGRLRRNGLRQSCPLSAISHIPRSSTTRGRPGSIAWFTSRWR